MAKKQKKRRARKKRFKAQSLKIGSIDEHMSCDLASVSKFCKSMQKDTLKDKSTHVGGITETIPEKRDSTSKETEKCIDWGDEQNRFYLGWLKEQKLFEQKEEYMLNQIKMESDAFCGGYNLAKEVVDDDTKQFFSFWLDEITLPENLEPEPPSFSSGECENSSNEDFKEMDEYSDDADIDCPERAELMMQKLAVCSEPEPPSFPSGECENSFNENFMELTLEERLKPKDVYSNDADERVLKDSF